MQTLKISTIGTIISVFLALAAAATVASSFIVLSQVEQTGGAWQSFEAGPSRKSEHLNQINKALGFGGMLHQYKDYLLVLDRKQIVAFQGKVREIRVALDAYFALGVNARERQALDDILGVINAYVTAIHEAEQMYKQGARSDVIARAIVIDDAPAIQGIDTLVAEINSLRDQSAATVNTSVAAASQISKISSVVIGIMLVTLLAVIVWFTRWRLGASMRLIGQTMTRLAEGDTATEVPAQDRADEIGEMARTVQVFKDSMIKTEQMAEQQRVEAEQKERRRQQMESHARSFEGSIGDVLSQLASMSTSLENASSTMTTTVGAASEKASTITESAEQAASNVETVAAAAEELSSSISEISRQVAQSTQIAGTAVAEVEGANEKVQGLADAANKIGEVVALITDIADQTNLLALNATIEAARAGEAGKGFAVVASEVKNLASQTTKATEEITQQIGGIQDATGDAVHAIGAIGDTIKRVNEIASAIAAAVEQQGAATQEIARNVEMAANKTSTVTSDIADVSTTVNDTGDAARQVQDCIHALGSQSQELQSVVNGFLSNVKEA